MYVVHIRWHPYVPLCYRFVLAWTLCDNNIQLVRENYTLRKPFILRLYAVHTEITLRIYDTPS